MPTVWGELRDDGKLVPYRSYLSQLEGVHVNSRLRIKVDNDRNGKFNGFYHLMLSKVADAVNTGPATTSIDALKNWVKLKTGRYDVVQLPQPTPDGQTHAIDYHSTSFAKMGEAEFHQFAEDTADLIAADLAPWIQSSPQWGEVQVMLAQLKPEVAA